MGKPVGFMLGVKVCPDGQHYHGALEVHFDQGEDHFYGTIDLGEWDPQPLGDTDHEVIMSVIHVLQVLGALPKGEIGRRARAVERPF